MPLTGWPYDLQALVPGGISVTASTGAGHYDVGQTIALSAHVAVRGTPVAGGTVSAAVTKPGGASSSVALTDAGGGTYTRSFTDAATCGLYQVTVTASGTDGVTPFTRQDRTIAFVGVPGNRVGDPCKADNDNDGLTDAKEIDIYHTDPLNPYTADDGYTDGQHVALGKDPLLYCPIMRADVDGDGQVSVLDLAQVAGHFLETVTPQTARLDQGPPPRDNTIDILDLATMASYFLQPVTACPGGGVRLGAESWPAEALLALGSRSTTTGGGEPVGAVLAKDVVGGDEPPEHAAVTARTRQDDHRHRATSGSVTWCRLSGPRHRAASRARRRCARWRRAPRTSRAPRTTCSQTRRLPAARPLPRGSCRCR